MRSRGIIVLAWLAVSGVPLLLALALFGCCALPFHESVHRVVPLCHLAETALAPPGASGRGDAGQPATPAPQKQDGQDGWRIAWKREAPATMLPPLTARFLGPQAVAAGTRNQLSLGALRCDDDVGTRLALLDTLRL